MSLPTSKAEAQKEFLRRVARFDEFTKDLEGAPGWAKHAFARAVFSMPIVENYILLDEKPEAFVRGYISGMITDLYMPFFEKIEKYTKLEEATDSSDEKTVKGYEVMAKYLGRIRDSMRNSSGEILSSTGVDRDEYIRGLERWRKIRPAGSCLDPGALGNLATEPYLFIAAFWREFEAFASLKEAYFALFCLFDKRESLSGNYEAFRKRAKAIGLRYDTK